MHVKTVPASYSVKADDDSGWEIVGWVSLWDAAPDSYGDVVKKNAFSKALQNQRGTGRPRFFMDHQSPLGRILSLEETDEGLKVHARISKTSIGHDARILLEDGAIGELSYGYDLADTKGQNKTNEHGGVDITEIGTLYEVSLVSLASLPEAVVTGVKHVEFENREAIANIRAELAKLKATDRSNMDTQTAQAKAASGSTDLPLDESSSWDGPAAVKALAQWASNEDGETDYNRMSKGFFWKADNPESQDDLKLPFARPDGDSLKAVASGVRAAAGVVQGAMGGASIPESDVEGVKAKIAAYYKKMEGSPTPPWQDDSDSSEGSGDSSDSGKAAEDTEDVENTPEASDERIAEAIEQVVKDLGDVAQMLREREKGSGDAGESESEYDSEEKAMDDFRRELAAMKSI